MRMLKIILVTLSLLGLAACGGGGSSSSSTSTTSSATVTGVATASQISVVTTQ